MLHQVIWSFGLMCVGAIAAIVTLGHQQTNEFRKVAGLRGKLRKFRAALSVCRNEQVIVLTTDEVTIIGGGRFAVESYGRLKQALHELAEQIEAKRV